MSPGSANAYTTRAVKQETPWIGYCWAVGSVALATALFLAANRILDLSHEVDLLYLPIVLACAIRFGAGQASAAAVAGLLCWDFFFIRPLYSLHVGSPHDLLVLTVFLVVSAVAARLADRLQKQSRDAAALEERNRMAREIHDTLAQGLTGIVIQLQAAERVEPDVSGMRAAVHQAREQAEQCLEEARRSVKALRPGVLEQRSLPSALQLMLEQMTRRTHVGGTLHVEGDEYTLPDGIATSVLRIGQEAITNALRHAGPCKVEVTVRYSPGTIVLRVKDDGKGFDETLAESALGNCGFGLAGMRERATELRGNFTLCTSPGGGTLVEIAAPVPGREAAR